MKHLRYNGRLTCALSHCGSVKNFMKTQFINEKVVNHELKGGQNENTI